MNRNSRMNPMIMTVLLLFIMRLARGGFSNFGDFLVSHLLMLPAIVAGLSLHEFGHAFVSDRLGDPTPRSQGRVTVNPLAHIDPVGFLALIFAGFGWGVPVQINPGYYKHRRRDEALVAIAGVTMNLILVILFTLITAVFYRTTGSFIYTTSGGIVLDILIYFISINAMLMVFNLLPVPPLDGFNLLTQIFGLEKYSWWYQIYQYGNIILIILIFTGGVSLVLSPLTGAIVRFCFSIIQG